MSTFISRYMMSVGIFSAYLSHCRSMSLPGGVPNGDLPTAFGRKRPYDDGTIDIIDYVTGIGNSSREQYIRAGQSVSH